MKLYKFLLCACLALPVMSCDDYLDIQPKGIVIPEKSEDYERLLNYAQLLKASESYPNFMTDDVFMPYEDDMTGGFFSLELPNQHLYAFNSEIFGEGESDGLWEYSYNRIYYYNVVIDDIMGATQDTEEHKKQLRAEALVGRAFEYLTLVNAYANHYDPSTAATDPGVPLMLDKNINKTNLQRATVQEVYDQIKADLDEAAPNLPEKPVLNAYRASKPVGYGMLARMYLYMGDYKKALENAVISLHNNSTLMSLFPYKVVDRDKYIGRIDVPDGDENPENIYIRLAPWTFGFSATAYASEELASLYDQEKDQRYLLYFTKYLGGIDLDYPLWAPYIYANMAMSTPEMYLIAAECEARIGSKDKAMEYINTLRDSRIIDNVPLVASDNKDALVKVLEERRREMPMLGCTRLIDLKRLNREPEFAKTIVHEVNGVEYRLEPNSPKYILPIPPSVLRFNPDMIPNIR